MDLLMRFIAKLNIFLFKSLNFGVDALVSSAIVESVPIVAVANGVPSEPTTDNNTIDLRRSGLLISTPRKYAEATA